MMIFVSNVLGALALAIATVPILVGKHLHHQDSLPRLNHCQRLHLTWR